MLKKWLSIAASVMVVLIISLSVIASEVVYEKPSDAQLFSDFNTPFTVVSWDDDAAKVDAGDGVNKVQILAKEGSTGHSTVDGAIKIEFKSSDTNPYVRFRHTLSFASTVDGKIATKYKYMVIRIKGEADNGISVSGGPGQGALCIGFGGATNWSKGFTFRDSDYPDQATAGKAHDGSTLAPITNEYQTYIIKMEDSYFSSMGDVSEGNQMAVRSIGNFNKTVYIDEIYFTDNIPQEKQPEAPEQPEEDEGIDPNEVKYKKPVDAQLYSDFNTPFTVISWDDNAQVDAGDGVNKVQILVINGSNTKQSTVNGALKIEFKSSDTDPYVRLRNTMSFADTVDGRIVSKYKYMVIRIRGTADEGISVSGGPGQGALCIGFGGASNWANGFTFRSTDYSGQGTAAKAPDGSTLAPITDKYQTLIIKMEDSYFSSMGDVSEGNQMSIRSIGNFNKTVYIDEIYFTNSIPEVDTGSDDGDDEPEYTDNNVIPADAIFIEDGRRDEFLLPFGDKKITFANGDKTSFLNEVTINDVTDPGAFTLSNGIITFNCAPDAYLNYSFGENYYVNYNYIVFRIRSTDGSDGSKFAVRLGSYGAQEVMFDKLRFDAGHYVKPITGEWQDIYVSTEDFNGLNGREYLKFHGKANGTFEIDCIYMTNTVPEGYEPGPEVPPFEEPTTDVTEPTSNVTEPTKDGAGTGTTTTTGTNSDSPKTGTTTTTGTNSGSPKTGTTFPMGIIVLAVFAIAAIILSVNRKTCKS